MEPGDSDDPGEEELDARASSIIGRMVIPSTAKRSSTSPASSKPKPARLQVGPTPSASAPSGKLSTSLPEPSPVPEMTSRGATRRSTIDTTSDGRLLRLQHAVQEDTEGLEGDFSELRALCRKARDEETDTGSSQGFKTMLKDVGSKAMAVKKETDGYL